MLCVFAAYRLAQGSVSGKEVAAFHHAYDVVAVEKHLGFFWELDIQSWFLQSPALVHLANAIYTYFYYPVLILFGIWAYNRHRKQYFTVRKVFLISAGIGFLCFAFYPLAPPRMLLDLGFVDTMGQYEAVNYDSSFFAIFANPYAAMPSMHFTWVLLVGIAIVHIVRSLWLKALGILFPVGMLIAIVATANHFILDAIAGAIVLGLAYGLFVLFTKLRRNHMPPSALQEHEVASG
jgi:hypothetical protein